MNRIKVGLLPLYLELYDRTNPELRSRIERFYTKVADKLREEDVDPVCVPVCRRKDEFELAASAFRREDVCAVVTLHLAYSPSMECIDALCGLDVPVVVLDTTQAYSFSNETGAGEIMYNHGIHGVQDMCNMLMRRDKRYFIVAGHFERSDAVARAAGLCRAAYAARLLRRSRVGIIGRPFAGMGDFQAPYGEMKETIGIDVVVAENRDMLRYVSVADAAAVYVEMEEDRARFDVTACSAETHERSARAGLMLRRWIEDKGLTAFTVNFLDIAGGPGLECMPFLEAGKAMARGIGYAGEGDVLTAALIGALTGISPDITFTEMFCPDWQGGSLFLSHMGEMNIDLAEGQPRLVEKDFPYTGAGKPAAVCGRYKPGGAVLVNPAPMGAGRYSLILCPVKVLGVDGADAMADSVHGWVRPPLPVEAFLERYSLAGGTHHLALVYGEKLEELAAFSGMLGFDVTILK